MQSRRDHLHAYQFSTSRLLQALTSGDLGVGDVPFRRARFGTILGVCLAVLACGAAVVYGLISPAPNLAWKQPGAIVVEKETGTRYINVGGMLRPTANYTSAMLVAGRSVAVQYVARRTLAGIPIGPAIGIPGAPDTLPAAKDLLPGTWTMCLKPGAAGSTVLDLAPFGVAMPAPARQRLLVSAPAAGKAKAGEFVLWNSTKYPIPDPAVLPALGLGNVTPVRANSRWLDAFATGTALRMARLPSAGKAGMPIAGKPAKVGRLFQVSAADIEQYYVLRTDGLAPVTRTEVALFSAAHKYVPPTRISPSDIAVAPASSDESLLHRLPDLLSGDIYNGDGRTLCAWQIIPGLTGHALLAVEGAADVAAGPDVVVPNGKGMLVHLPLTDPSPAAQRPPVYLISDNGMKYLIDGDDAVRALGYSVELAQSMPPEVLRLVPSGPTLGISRAQKAVQWAPG